MFEMCKIFPIFTKLTALGHMVFSTITVLMDLRDFFEGDPKIDNKVLSKLKTELLNLLNQSYPVFLKPFSWSPNYPLLVLFLILKNNFFFAGYYSYGVLS